MKVAIPASDNKIDALLDERFGRCPFFCFYDTETDKIEFEENEKKDASGGVGPQVAELLAGKGVNEIWSSEVGPRARDTLNKLNIRIKIIEKGQTIRQLIKNHNN